MVREVVTVAAMRVGARVVVEKEAAKVVAVMRVVMVEVVKDEGMGQRRWRCRWRCRWLCRWRWRCR